MFDAGIRSLLIVIVVEQLISRHTQIFEYFKFQFPARLLKYIEMTSDI